MGCWNGKTVQIKAKITEKNTIDELPHSKPKHSEEKLEDVIHDTDNDDYVEFAFDENSFIKLYKTQEFNYSNLDQDFYHIISIDDKGLKRWRSIKSNRHDELKRPSEWKRFLIRELNMAKIKEEDTNSDNAIKYSLPPLIDK